MSERRFSCSGVQALVRMFCTPPSAPRYRSLFPRNRSVALTEIALSLIPQTGFLTEMDRWERSFKRAKFTPRPRRKPS